MAESTARLQIDSNKLRLLKERDALLAQNAELRAALQDLTRLATYYQTPSTHLLSIALDKARSALKGGE